MSSLLDDIDGAGNLTNLLEAAVSAHADRKAFCGQDFELSFSELSQRAQRFATWLVSGAGVKPGDRVAVMLPNHPDFLAVLMGLWQAGAVGVPINPLYTADELAYQLGDSGACGLVGTAPSLGLAQKSSGGSISLHWTVQIGPGAAPGGSAMIWNDIVEFAPAARSAMPVVGPDNLALLQYTGGTTGMSKGAMLTHRNVIAVVLQTKHALSGALHGANEVVLTALPLYHIFALVVNALLMMHVGARSILVTNPREPAELMAAFSRHPISVVTGVNTLFVGLLTLADRSGLALGGVRLALGGGSAIQKSVSDRWRALTGHHILEGYGLSETSSVISVNRPDEEAFTGTVGPPIEQTRFAIVDDELRPVAQGQIGEICVTGPQVMKGYWRRPADSSTAFTPEGFFRTGDLGYTDAKGRVTICDRKKDMVLVSGFNVFPNEVESVLATHPGVLECAVSGLPDDATGEAVHAWIVPRANDALPTAAELEAHCREYLTAYKVPKSFHIVKALPKSTVGKVLRRELRAAAIQSG